MTRTNQASAVEGRNAAQGRPLGLLARWLRAARLADSKDEHESLVAFLFFEERRNAREELLQEQNGAAMANKERPPRDGEGPKPEGQA